MPSTKPVIRIPKDVHKELVKMRETTLEKEGIEIPMWKLYAQYTKKENEQERIGL